MRGTLWQRYLAQRGIDLRLVSKDGLVETDPHYRKFILPFPAPMVTESPKDISIPVATRASMTISDSLWPPSGTAMMARHPHAVYGSLVDSVPDGWDEFLFLSPASDVSWASFHLASI